MGDSITKAYRNVVGHSFDVSNPAETTRLRAALFQSITSNDADINLIKTHNQNEKAFGIQLIPSELTMGAIYIVRDPRDMVLSYASHHGLTIDRAISGIDNVNNATAGNDQNVHQYLGRWSDHVASWTRTKKFPVLIIRYEDMLAKPEKTFASVVRRIGMPMETERLKRAIDHSSFGRLKQQEDADGFVENSEHQERFFRRGTAGQYQNLLSDTQIMKIESDHAKVMRRYRYL